MVTGTTQNLLVFRGNQPKFLDILFCNTLRQNSTAPNSVNSSIYSEIETREKEERRRKEETILSSRLNQSVSAGVCTSLVTGHKEELASNSSYLIDGE